MEFRLFGSDQRANLGIAQGFLVGVAGAVASFLAGPPLIIIGEGLTQFRVQILAGVWGGMQVGATANWYSHAASNGRRCPHREETIERVSGTDRHSSQTHSFSVFGLGVFDFSVGDSP